MMQQFLNSLAENAADIVTIAVVAGVIAGGIWYVVARKRHVDSIRLRLGADIEVSSKIKDTLARVFNADVAEVGAIGAVSLMDIAWQYSMADPSVWDHFQGPSADHISDAVQNLDVLKGALGDHTMPFVDNVVGFLRGVEATQVFTDLADKLPMLGDSTAFLLDAKTSSMVDALAAKSSVIDAVADGKSGVAGDALVHIPVVTIGFATYRAWRRSQHGAGLKRNAEFAAIEISTRTTGSVLGGKLGGVAGTAIVPGVGTIIGAVAGAVAGAIGGAFLGEAFKKRHVEKANEELNTSLTTLGRAYIDDDQNFRKVVEVFRRQENEYVSSLKEMRRRLRRYSFSLRPVWPDEKLVLLQETVRLAEQRLGSVKEGTADAVDRLNFLHAAGNARQMGILLSANPALCKEIPADTELVDGVRHASDRLRHELVQLGLEPEAALT